MIQKNLIGRPALSLLCIPSFIVMVLLSCAVASADQLIPFVIPARPNPDSPISAPPAQAITSDSDRLVAGSWHFFRNSQRVRIWGVNLSFGANFPAYEDAPHVAARLAAAGVNAVRCHHMDSARWPRGLWNARDGKTIEPQALDRLDYFIDQLARRGIYANINLHVGRAHSKFLGLPEPNRKYDKIVTIFTPALVDAQKEYARRVLTHPNPYRNNTRYADDPAIAFVEITNENSFFMWAAEQTLRTLPHYYAKILQQKFNLWLRAKYGSDDRLRKAWAQRTNPPGRRVGLQPGESLAAENIPLFAPTESPSRTLDRMKFLAETEKAYFDDMRNFIKNDLGCKALVTGTIVFGPLGLYAQSHMDYIDAHAYWQHPRFPGRPWDQSNWLIDQKPMTDHPNQATLFRLAAQRLHRKPYTVSEYNHPAPLDAQAECVPMIASFAAAQDWDGIWLYTYSHSADQWDRRYLNSYFDIDTNPAKWAFIRSGAAIFREAAINPVNCYIYTPLADPSATLEAIAALHLKYGRDMLAARAVPPETMLSCQLLCDITGRNGHYDIIGPGATINWLTENGHGIYLARGRRASAYTGHAHLFEKATGGKIQIDGPEFLALTIASLETKPWQALDHSKKILITACGRCENTAMKFSTDRRTVGTNWGGPPVRIEPVEGTITLPEGPWECHALAPDGMPAQQVPVSHDPEKDILKLSAKYKTIWYLLRKGSL